MNGADKSRQSTTLAVKGLLHKGAFGKMAAGSRRRPLAVVIVSFILSRICYRLEWWSAIEPFTFLARESI